MTNNIEINSSEDITQINSWDLTKLKYVCKVENGSTPKSNIDEFWDDSLKWFTPYDFRNITNNFYLEIQRIGKEFENVDENTILTLACDHYLPLVATNNVYYEGPDHYEAHDALMCIEKKLYVSQKDRKKLSREHYFKTHDEMNELFSNLPEAINRDNSLSKNSTAIPNDVAMECIVTDL